MIRGKQQKELWEWISRYVRLRDAKLSWRGSHYTCTCPTCHSWKWPKDMDAGHVFNKGSARYAAIQFDTRFIFAQCKGCNKYRMNYPEVREAFEAHARKVNGDQVVDTALTLARAQGHKLSPSEIGLLIEGYKRDVEKLLQEKGIARWWK